MEKMSTALLITLVLAAVVDMVVLGLLLNCKATCIIKKHQEARQRVKRYNHILTRLLKMYEKGQSNGQFICNTERMQICIPDTQLWRIKQ